MRTRSRVPTVPSGDSWHDIARYVLGSLVVPSIGGNDGGYSTTGGLYPSRKLRNFRLLSSSSLLL